MIITWVIKTVAFIELSLGVSTFFSLLAFTLPSAAAGSLNIMIFVMVSVVISTMLGVGIFKRSEIARVLLVFFSGYVILTKILVFSNLLQARYSIATFIPPYIKNTTSIIFHTFVILFFTRQSVKRYFSSRI